MNTLRFHVMSIWAALVFVLAFILALLRNRLVVAILITLVIAVSMSGCNYEAVIGGNGPHVLSGG